MNAEWLGRNQWVLPQQGNIANYPQKALHVDTYALVLHDYRKPQEPRVVDEADVRQLLWLLQD